MPFQAPRGTHDILPVHSAAWQHLEEVFRDLTRLYGYGEIRTPMFEDAELFIRSAGETSDVVNKEMYRFKDKGDRDLCLKPEGTAPAIRAFVEHSLAESGLPVRLWYLTHVFRYDRPQKGRYRQSHQLGLELLGSPSPYADAEVIEITMEFYSRIGVSNRELRLNSIGRDATREAYRSALLLHFQSYLIDKDTEQRARAEKNPLRLLDSKDPSAISLAHSAPSILDHLEEDSKTHFEELQAILNDRSIKFILDPRVVRGLDYYTDTVFEVTSTSLGAQSSLCGGGRYDTMVKQLGGSDCPAVGVGIGVERALIALEAEAGLPERPGIQVFVVNATPAARQIAVQLASELRKAGYAAQFDFENRNLKGQFKQADRIGAKFAVVIGDDEMAQSSFTVKDLKSATQESVSQDQLTDYLRQRC